MTSLSTSQATFATMRERLSGSSLPRSTQREVDSAISTFCRVFHTQPHLVEASAPNLQRMIQAALPAAVRVSASRWVNVMSLIRTGMRLIDTEAFPARLKTRMLPSWETLLAMTEARSVRRRLSRLARWASHRGIEPADMSDAVLEAYGQALAAHCIASRISRAHQTAGRAWNEARAMVPGWPSVTLCIPDNRRNPSMEFSDFPASLGEDVEAFLRACAHEDDSLDTDRNPLRPSTIRTFRTKLRRIPTAIVQSGVAPGMLCTLADVVSPAHARAALEVMRKRAGKKTTGDIHKVAQLIVIVAKHHVHMEGEDLAKLVGYCRKLKPKEHTLTVKNRSRLAQFDDPRQMDRFLTLPDRLMHQANCVRVPTTSEALQAQSAVLLSVLQYIPIRISNIAAIELGRTLFLAERTGEIVFGCDEVKNDVEINFPLPPRLVELIWLYLKKYHPLLAPVGCPMLFPNPRTGAHKLCTTLSRQVGTLLRKECGIVFNPHLARHLAAKMMLQANPGAYGTVMQLLHHKQIQTTIDAYCGTEHEAALRSYTAIVERHRDSSGSSRGPSGQGKTP